MLVDYSGVRIFIYNVHLTAGGIVGPESKKAEKLRSHQVEQLLKDAENNSSEFSIILGDLNCGPKVSSMNFSAFEAAGFTGFGDNIQTWDPKNSLNIDGIHKHCPSQCIDRILFNDKIKNLLLTVRHS
mgnify:FL=1